MPHESAMPETAEGPTVEPFSMALSRRELVLKRDETRTLQINVGLVCNQVCKHCHLDAGPHRTESMDEAAARQAAEYAARCGFETVDVTGGAPELNPHLELLLDLLAGTAPRVMLRANLTALADKGPGFLEFLVRRRIVVVASFPSLSASQTEAQRGRGVFDQSVRSLRMLNEAGYGRDGTGLELDLVSNPAGAFLPPEQANAESRFRGQLENRFGLVFSNLYTFANVPLGRFKKWLENSGNYHSYLERLAGNFNPCALEKVMCRSQVSMDWDGYLYDCDFNIAAGLPLGGRKIHVSEMTGPPEPGSRINIGDHCYTCTAGAGFT